MNRQELRVDTEASDQNKSQQLTSLATADSEKKHILENILQTASSSLLSRVSHILNLFPSAHSYEDEQHIAYPIGQRVTLGSPATSGKVTTITELTLAGDVPFIDDNETGVIVNQLRRSQAPHPYEYKASVDIKEQSGAPLRTTAMALSGHNEVASEIPINVNHVRHQRTRGIKQTATSISQLSTTVGYTEIGESAVQLDQLRRIRLSQPVRYRMSSGSRLSAGTILKTPSALSQDEPAQESCINVTQLRQPTSTKHLVLANTTKHRPSSVRQLTATTDAPILNETAIHLDQIHRSNTPQTIQYKAPAHIRPSIGSIRLTTSVLGQEAPAQETSVNIVQLRQRSSKTLPAFVGAKRQISSIMQPTIITDIPILGDTAVRLDNIHRPHTPQTIHYKPPTGIPPSRSFTKKTTSVFSHDEPAQETSIIVSQLRQPAYTDRSVNNEHRCANTHSVPQAHVH